MFKATWLNHNTSECVKSGEDNNGRKCQAGIVSRRDQLACSLWGCQSLNTQSGATPQLPPSSASHPGYYTLVKKPMGLQNSQVCWILEEECKSSRAGPRCRVQHLFLIWQWKINRFTQSISCGLKSRRKNNYAIYYPFVFNRFFCFYALGKTHLSSQWTF